MIFVLWLAWFCGFKRTVVALVFAMMALGLWLEWRLYA
jgi:hypothetical protein